MKREQIEIAVELLCEIRSLEGELCELKSIDEVTTVNFESPSSVTRTISSDCLPDGFLEGMIQGQIKKLKKIIADKIKELESIK